MRRAIIAASAGAADTLVTDINTALGLPRALTAGEVTKGPGLITAGLPSQTWAKLGTVVVPYTAQVAAHQGEGSTPIPGWASTKRIEAKVLCLGDSITVGGGSTGSLGYKKRISDNSNNAFYRSRNVGPYVAGAFNDARHAGVSGNTIAQMLARFDRDVYRWRPDALVIHAGTNGGTLTDLGGAADDDTTAETYAVDAANAMEALLDYAYTRLSSIGRVVVCKVPPRSSHTNYVTRFNGKLAAVIAATPFSASQIVVVDPGVLLAECPDGVHPNDTGHNKIGDAAWTGTGALKAFFDEPGP